MQTLTEEYVASLTRGNVMALDVAKHCGFYTLGDYGTQYFPNTKDAPKKLGPDYAQHKAFREWLIGKLTEHRIKAVAAEDVIFVHKTDYRKLCEFRGILFEVCETLDIPIVVFNPVDIKKHATGYGNANKQQMIYMAENRYKIEVGKDDNLADAVHIYFYFIHRYKL